MRAHLLRAAAAFALSIPGPALAAGWDGPATVAIVPGSQASLTDAQGALGADGAALVAWRSGDVVQAARRGRGVAWSPPDPVSAAGAEPPRVAIDATGEALVAWVRGGVLQVTRGPSGQGFGGAADIQDYSPREPALGADAAGRVLLAWRDHFFYGASGYDHRLGGSTRPPGGDFGAPVNTFYSGSGAPAAGEALDLAVAPAGHALAVWLHERGVRWARGTTSAGFAALGAVPGAGPLTVPAGAGPPRVALDAAGNGVVVADLSGCVGWSAIPAGGTPGQAACLGSVASPVRPAVAMDAGGTAIVTFATGGVARSAVRAPGGSFGPAQDIPGATSGADAPDVAMGPDGTAVAVWRQDGGIRFSARPPGGAFSPSAPLPTQGAPSAPSLAADPAGHVLAVWTEKVVPLLSPALASAIDPGVVAGPRAQVRAAIYDPVPPRIDDLSVPAAATAGTPVSMSVAASDVGVTSVAWDLGDGTLAAGPAVSHAFATPGITTVTVRVRDGAGNETIVTRRLSVAPAGSAIAGPATVAVTTRRPALRARFGRARAGGRIWLTVRGRTDRALRGRQVLVERRAGRGSAALCRLRVRSGGAFGGRCRVDRFVAAGTARMWVRVRVARTPRTLPRASPWTMRRLTALEGSRRPARASATRGAAAAPAGPDGTAEPS